MVTGATGFIGGRLARRLATEAGAGVTGLGRDLSRAASLQSAGVSLRQIDLLDVPAMRETVKGQDVVFHVAAWMGPRHGEREKAWAVNVFATLHLLRSAARAGVSRVVYVSSIAAYGAPGAPLMDEARPLALRQRSTYGRTKAEAETKAMQASRSLGVELAVVRPGIVYGPGSYSWSLRTVRLLQRGLPVIFGDGKGHAHPVYVDNLVDGMLLAASRPQAAGEAFNFVDRPVPWREWFGRHGDLCGRRPRRLPLWMARLALAAGEFLPLGLSINRNLVAYYTNQTIYPRTKAQKLLGYQPAVDLDEGLRHTTSWLRQEGYL